jgi:hypothetical protein
MDNKEIAQMVLDFLTKAGTAIVEKGFPLAVKYVIAQAIGNLIGFGLSLTVVIVCIKYIMGVAKYTDKKGSEDITNEQMIGMIISSIVGILALIICLFSSPVEAIRMLISPEWYAILNIIHLVK